jgi:hypothetical protein
VLGSLVGWAKRAWSRQCGSGERTRSWQRLPNRISQRSDRLCSARLSSTVNVHQSLASCARESGLLGCEKGEEKRSRAEVTQLDLRLPSLRFHSNDQAAVEVVQHGGQCARWRGISAAPRASPLTGPSAHGPGSSGTRMGQLALSVMQRAASAADPLRFIDAARKRDHDHAAQQCYRCS